MIITNLYIIHYCVFAYSFFLFFPMQLWFKKNMPIDLSYELVMLVLFQHLIFNACVNFCGCRSYCFWTFFGLLYCFPGTNFNMFSFNYVHFVGLTFLLTSYLYTEWMYTSLFNTLVNYTYLLHVDTLNGRIHAYLLRWLYVFICFILIDRMDVYMFIYYVGSLFVFNSC